MVFLECLITRRNNAAGEEAAPGKGSQGKGGFGRGFQPCATGWAAQKGCALWALGLQREGSGARCPCSLWTRGMGCGRGAGAWAPPPAPAAASQGAAPEAWGMPPKREDGKKWGCLVWERENSRRGGSFGGLGYREGADVFLGPGTRSCWGLGAGAQFQPLGSAQTSAFLPQNSPAVAATTSLPLFEVISGVICHRGQNPGRICALPTLQVSLYPK